MECAPIRDGDTPCVAFSLRDERAVLAEDSLWTVYALHLRPPIADPGLELQAIDLAHVPELGLEQRREMALEAMIRPEGSPSCSA